MTPKRSAAVAGEDGEQVVVRLTIEGTERIEVATADALVDDPPPRRWRSSPSTR